MTMIPTPEMDEASPSCATDRSCPPESSCCGGTPATGEQAVAPTSKAGFRAAALGVLCIVGCLAIPLAAGGAAAMFGAVSGTWWVVIGSVLLTAGLSAVVLSRRRAGGRVC